MRVCNKVRGMISLAAKAGRVVSGESAVRAAAQKGQAALLLADKNASANTMDRMGRHRHSRCSMWRNWARASAGPEGRWSLCATRALPKPSPASMTNVNTGV